ncbi:hypothetical protein [Myxacorys almedinensis]|uniref:hypothetical protein n=1 Tax=Myxacorys almedinensis TaxID=2651157 RepID=UPI001EE4AFD3|nr:hypothetical protein [Myxacorys almedinensis]
MSANSVSSTVSFDFNPDHLDPDVGTGSIVPISGELTFNIQISTSKLLDILTSLSLGKDLRLFEAVE